MLKNLIELGRDVKIKFDSFNNWQELNFNPKDKEELGSLNHVTSVFNSSIKFEFDSNHTIIPSQYILYALTIKDFALGLKNHLDIFDNYKNNKKSNQIGDEITNRTFDRAAINVDEYSQSILMEPIINNDYNFNAKSIINGTADNYKVRGTSDFFASVILKIINVPDASSAILGKLIYNLAGNPILYNYLESRFIDHLPYLVQDSKIKSFTKKTFAYIEQYDNLQNIKDFIVKNSDNSFSSIKFNDHSLTSIFKTSSTLLSEENLKRGGKLRYFSDPLFYLNNEFYYFSTEWTDGTGSRLDLESLKSIIALTYPQFTIIKNNSVFQLISSSIKINSTKIKQVEFSIEQVIKDYQNSGVIYSDQLITRYISSLSTKPFVLLSGLSGSGKTKLAQSFAQWVCEYKAQYCIVPVGADWTNREPLLGYVNALDSTEYILPENGALQLLIEANKAENINKPYFLILDEMNLSHVERYFADFLSVMESKDKFKLHSDKEKEKSGVPFELGWPKNLFIVGTVNIDETTYMFSPKVLDRANVIEFRVNETEIEDFLNTGKEITSIIKMGAAMGNSFVDIAKINKNEGDFTQLNTELLEFFKNLQELGAEFGYRTATEIQTLFSKIDLVNPDYLVKENEKIDIAIMQKLLPKLHGSRRKLLKTLNLLAQKCLEKEQEIIFNERGLYTILEDNSIKYKLSFEKIARMYKNAIENGFASYAEA
jgi:energy-coupling factor transporter ATP-binding protein EcfA2